MAKLVPVESKNRPRLVPIEDEPESREQESMGAKEIASGTAQTLLTLGSGAVAEPISGGFGLIRGAVGKLMGEEDVLSNMVNTIEGWRDFITIEPFTESGRRVASAVAIPFEYYMGKAEEKGREDFERTGLPIAGTITQTGMEFLPSMIGVKGVRGVPKRDIRDVSQFARQEGINIRRRGEGLREEVGQAAKRRSDAVRGGASEGIKKAVDTAREVAKNEIDRLYESARSKRAGIPVDEAIEFPSIARKSLADFDVDDMPKVQRRLNELDEIMANPRGRRMAPTPKNVRLRDLEDWRKRINKNRSTDPSENAALGVLKGQYDNWLDAKFNADMISGDRSAIQTWKEARGAVQRYKEQFKDDKVIAQFARKEATPEEIRQWIFGASTVGAKKPAATTVKRIKKLVGEDSPEFAALRTDAAYDVMSPLFNDEPSLKGFVRRYDRIVQENPSLAKELWGEDGLRELKRLRDFASAAVKRGEPMNMDGFFLRTGSVFAAGHGIAKSALKVSGLQRLGRLAAETANKRKFLEEVFGSPIDDPMFSRIMKIGAGTQSAGDLAPEEKQPMGAN